jgi:hypothetical protein
MLGALEGASASSFSFLSYIFKLHAEFWEAMMNGISKIWVNEQIDPSGLLYACIACQSEQHAIACHDSFESKLTDTQRQEGWVASLRTVESWDDVPASALKLSY